MADDVSITEGSGTAIAADDVSGVKHQRVKITVGADSIAVGDASHALGLPVAPARTLAVEDVVEIAHGSITGSFANTSIANIGTNTHVLLTNNTNGDLYFRWATSGNAKHWVPAYTSRVLPIPSGATELQVKYDTDPDAGKLVLEVSKG